MRSFKDSGIAYLGRIPKHWEVKKLKYVAKAVLGKMLCNEKQKGYSYCFYLKSKNLQWLNVEISQVEKMWFSEYEKTIYRIKKDDLLLSEGGEVGKTCIWNNEMEECYIQNSVHKVTIDAFNIPRFFLYVFFMYGKFGVFESVVNRVSIAHLVLEKLINLDVPVPPLKEQKEIAEFLDFKCEKIQNFIDKKQKLITLLQEKKQALINEAVTKGLDSKAELKDSGIETLGRIPKHWEVRRVKYIAYVKGRIGFHGLKSSEFQYDKGAHLVTGNDFANNKVNWKQCRRISETRYYEDPNIHLKNDDLLITKDGTIGKTAIVTNCPKQATLNSGIFLVRINKKLCFIKYAFYAIDSPCFKKFIISKTCGSTITHLYQSDFNDFKIPLPPLHEQEQIAQFLDSKIAKMDIIVEKVKKQIELIKEYKITLISEAVCGRIKIAKERE